MVAVDLDRDAKGVYLMEQYRQAKITHRQLEEALDLGFHATEQLLKQRGMGQDVEIEDFEAGRELFEEIADEETAADSFQGRDMCLSSLLKRGSSLDGVDHDASVEVDEH